MAWPKRPYAIRRQYSSARWQRARRARLDAAGWQCEIRGPGCLGRASQVDHIYGLAANPDHRWLQAVCSVCHKKKTATERAAAQRKPDPAPRPRTQW